MPVNHDQPTPDQLQVSFDDNHAVANAGLLLPAILAERLGIQQAADELVRLGGPAGAHPGAKLLTVVHAMLAGGDCIDDLDVLRCGSTARVLGHRVLAPSTIGTFLRAFTFGHTRQLDRLTETALARAWAAGAGPGDGPMTIDCDSTIIEVYGHHKAGRQLRLHPQARLPPAAGHPRRHRRGAARPLADRPRPHRPWHAPLRGRAARPAAPRGRHRRADLPGRLGVLVGHHDQAPAPPPGALLDHRAPHQARPPGDRCHPRARLDGHPLPSARGRAGRRDPLEWRPADRAPRAPPPSPGRAVPGLGLPRVRDRPAGHRRELDQDHRRHAVVELAIRDLKHGAGLAHCPSGRFAANAAWLLAATLAHNLLRWVAALGLGTRDELVVAKTIRKTLLGLPGRLTRSARRWRLHLPRDWPWARWFAMALARLRCIPFAA